MWTTSSTKYQYDSNLDLSGYILDEVNNQNFLLFYGNHLI